MPQVDVSDAATSLPRLLQMLEDGEEDGFIIARDGKPIANLTIACHGGGAPSFLGFRDGAYDIPDDIDVDKDEIAKLFGA